MTSTLRVEVVGHSPSSAINMHHSCYTPSYWRYICRPPKVLMMLQTVAVIVVIHSSLSRRLYLSLACPPCELTPCPLPVCLRCSPTAGSCQSCRAAVLWKRSCSRFFC